MLKYFIIHRILIFRVNKKTELLTCKNTIPSKYTNIYMRFCDRKY